MADRIVLLHHGRILGGLDPRQGDAEGRAAAGLALDAYVAAVLFDAIAPGGSTLSVSGVASAIVWFIQPDVYDVSVIQGSALVATGMST